MMNNLEDIFLIEVMRFKKGGEIKIKEENKGKFTSWCKRNGYDSVSEACIKQGKEYCDDGKGDKKNDSEVCKMATFAKNAKSWNKNGGKFQDGGKMNILPGGVLHEEENTIRKELNYGSKGIPVIDCGEGQCRKMAEIEKCEYIFQLPQTQMIEKLIAEYQKTKNEELLVNLGTFVTKEVMSNTNNMCEDVDIEDS